MKIDFENLGNIEKGSIELNDFTLFCGKNNSGKTYAMYSIYGLLNPERPVNFDFVKSIAAKLKQDGYYSLKIKDAVANHKQEMIDYIQHSFKSSLPNLFGVDASIFANTKIQLRFSDEGLFENSSFSFDGITETITNDEILFTLDKTKSQPDFILSFYISERLVNILLFDWMRFFARFLLLPAERAGINLLLKELFSVRNLAIQQAQNDNPNAMRLLNEVVKARYAEPLKDYMQYINGISGYQKEDSSYCQYAEAIQYDVLGGEYEVDEFNNIFFIPSDSKNKLPLHFSSSTVKTLFGLVFYLRHQAKKGDCLMIDEPELNLHPDNQRKVARVLAQLVNAGLKVIVSTHSDYFVRELNNLIMLKKDFAEAKGLQEKYGYADNELLEDKQVSAYLFDDKKITPMTSNESGIIIAKTFNEVINSMNKSSNEIYYALQDAKELENW